MSSVTYTACIATVALCLVQIAVPADENDLYHWSGYNTKSQKIEIKRHKTNPREYREYRDGKDIGWLPLQMFLPAGVEAVILQEGSSDTGPWVMDPYDFERDVFGVPSVFPLIITNDALYYGGNKTASGKWISNTQWLGGRHGAEFSASGATEQWATWTFVDGGRDGKKIPVNYLESVFGPALIMVKYWSQKLPYYEVGWVHVCDGTEYRKAGDVVATGTWLCGGKECFDHCCKDRECCDDSQTCGSNGKCS